jgi:hypothetical protein
MLVLGQIVSRWTKFCRLVTDSSSRNIIVVDTPPPQQTSDAILSDPMAALTKGFSFLASNASSVVGVLGTTVVKGAELAVSGAETLGATLAENVIKPTTVALRDPNFQNNLSGTISSLQQTVSQLSKF